MADSNSPARHASRASKPPVSAHPAFPAIVALWFAALLGLGCMVLPAALLETVMASVGLAQGFGGRAIFAAAAAAAGGFTGCILGRRIAVSHANSPSSGDGRNFAPAPRAPFNPREAMEQVEREDAENRGNRRRSLAMQETDRESDFLIFAPVPGGGVEPPRIGELQAGANTQPAGDALEARPSQMAEIAETEPPASFQEPQPLQQLEKPAEPAWLETAIDSGAADAAPDSPEARPFDRPLVFHAPSLARRTEEGAAGVADFAPEVADDRHTGQRVELELVGEEPADETHQGEWVAAPLDQLGLVQLVQRLGHSLEQRRSLLAARPVTVEAPAREAVFAAELEAAPAEEATQAMAAFFNRQQLAPEAVEEEADDEFAASFDLPLGRGTPFALPEPLEDVPLAEEVGAAETCASEEGEVEDWEEEAAESDFGSLVEMHNPFRYQESGFVRIEEPEDEEQDGFIPAVIFPSQQTRQVLFGAPAASAEPAPAEAVVPGRPFDPPSGLARIAPAQADEALREALAKLQRAN